MDLVIDRLQWFRGNGSLRSLLLGADEMKCCLGFYCLAINLNPDLVRGVGSPQTLAARMNKRHIDLPPEMFWLLSESVYDPTLRSNSNACCHLIATNDNCDIPPDMREKIIIGVFAKHGVTVSFIN